jgi:hypothetical protein
VETQFGGMQPGRRCVLLISSSLASPSELVLATVRGFPGDFFTAGEVVEIAGQVHVVLPVPAGAEGAVDVGGVVQVVV